MWLPAVSRGWERRARFSMLGCLPSLTLEKGLPWVWQAVAGPAAQSSPVDAGSALPGAQCKSVWSDSYFTFRDRFSSLHISVQVLSSAPGQLSYSTASLEEVWSFKQKIWAVCLGCVSLRPGVLRWSLWLGQFCANSHLAGVGRKHTQKQAVKKQRCCQMKLGETFLWFLCSRSKLHLCTCKSGSLFVFRTLSLLHTANALSALLVVAHFLPLPVCQQPQLYTQAVWRRIWFVLFYKSSSPLYSPTFEHKCNLYKMIADRQLFFWVRKRRTIEVLCKIWAMTQISCSTILLFILKSLALPSALSLGAGI